MTLETYQEVICFFCGNKSEQNILWSTNSCGSPDLDTRPPEMERSTMHAWLQYCPYCQYVAEDIASATDLPKDFLSSKQYLDFGIHKPNSDLLKEYLLKARISQRLGDHQSAFWDYIHAAWVADDPAAYENEEDEICYIEEGDVFWSINARKLAIEAFDNLPADTVTETWKVIKADLLRKSGQFDRLISEYAGVQFSEEILNQIIAIQIEKAKLKDTKTYTIAEVLPDMEK